MSPVNHEHILIQREDLPLTLLWAGIASYLKSSEDKAKSDCDSVDNEAQSKQTPWTPKTSSSSIDLLMCNLGKSVNFYEPWFLYPSNGDIDNVFSVKIVLWRQNEVKIIKDLYKL